MKPERVKFELGVIYDRIQEMRKPYEENKSVRQEHIDCVTYDKLRKYVWLQMNTYAFKIYRSKTDELYNVEWLHKDMENPGVFVIDGMTTCVDLARVIQTINEYLYGAFCPARGAWWLFRERPENYTKNQRWP